MHWLQNLNISQGGMHYMAQGQGIYMGQKSFYEAAKIVCINS